VSAHTYRINRQQRRVEVLTGGKAVGPHWMHFHELEHLLIHISLGGRREFYNRAYDQLVGEGLIEEGRRG
jgi:hypothetical protein